MNNIDELLLEYSIRTYDVRRVSRLKQTCMLFSVWSRLKKDKIHLQVKNILQYGCYIFQTFLLCAMGPYLSANKKSFEYSLNWRNSGDMYTVGHQGYHGGLSTEMFFKSYFSSVCWFLKKKQQGIDRLWFKSNRLVRKFRSNFQDLKFWIWLGILIFPQKRNLWPSFVPKPLWRWY